MNRLAIVLAVGVVCVSGMAVEARTWTDIYGNQLNGTFRAFNKNNGIVTITLNGRRILAPFSGFCRDDRDFIIEELRKDGREAEVERYDTPIPEMTEQQNQFGPGGGGQEQPGAAGVPSGGGPAVGGPARPIAGGLPGGGNFSPGTGVPGIAAGSGPQYSPPGVAANGGFPGQGNAFPQTSPIPPSGLPTAPSLAGSGIPGADPMLPRATPVVPAGQPPVAAGGYGSDPRFPQAGPAHVDSGWSGPSQDSWNRSSRSQSNEAYESGRKGGQVMAYVFMAAVVVAVVVWFARS